MAANEFAATEGEAHLRGLTALFQSAQADFAFCRCSFNCPVAANKFAATKGEAHLRGLTALFQSAQADFAFCRCSFNCCCRACPAILLPSIITCQEGKLST
ncbi:MAG: hypothetical protein KF770_07465 [Anaerolineae bacterium]|nr:hypothetical protein [Anaerolineae bacterium]